MIQKRTTQIIFQTIYCTLAVIAIFSSLGLFNRKFNSDFYVYYTNLSNYICFAFMFASLAVTIRLSRKGDGYVSLAPAFKFMCSIMIMVTLLVYNILLAKDNSAFDYFTSLNNLLMHLILPIMFILDFVLFYEHGKVRWYYPLLCVIMPLVYVIYVLIRAAIVKGSASVIYPYFFLDVDKLGWGGFFIWISVLVVIFIAIGYILYVLDNIKRFKAAAQSNRIKSNQKDENEQTGLAKD